MQGENKSHAVDAGFLTLRNSSKGAWGRGVIMVKKWSNLAIWDLSNKIFYWTQVQSLPCLVSQLLLLLNLLLLFKFTQPLLVLSFIKPCFISGVDWVWGSQCLFSRKAFKNICQEYGAKVVFHVCCGYAVPKQLLCGCHAVAILLQCCCYVIAMLLLCNCFWKPKQAVVHLILAKVVIWMC